MEIIVVILLLVLIALILVLFWRMRSTDDGKSRLEAFLNEKFIDFSERIHRTMDKTREEVEKSKDVLSDNAIKTLGHIKSMTDTISSLMRQQEKAQQLGQSLEYLLQTPKLRGNYSEAILEEMLDRVLPKGIWEKQYAISAGERVDAVIKFKDIVIPIDAKFPRDDYQKYLSAANDAERKTHWSNYEKALKFEINSIREKYIKPEKGTSEFALLFIPSESIYYETIADRNHLGDPSEIHEYASQRKVIPVSPNTFYAFLNIIMLGVRNIEIASEAKKLQEELSKVERDFSFFYKKFESIGKALAGAVDSYETGERHIQRFKKDLESALKLDKNFQIEEAPRALEEEGTHA